ncbi:MAG: hypothetical protein Q8K71_02285 [Polaromonas sp.]|nr:hypothetical protein [Polaromonas sp.]
MKVHVLTFSNSNLEGISTPRWPSNSLLANSHAFRPTAQETHEVLTVVVVAGDVVTVQEAARSARDFQRRDR